ncbi:NAD(P)-binding protein [Lophium mytilinum]|uniref:NAD(P)-binding protein n=1 Tax=Lophium mytilinum TaxID=390894 RepID=A0A6A6QW16_9PEZI|nr:NAD(P)-binding protein [Lophium mytilinum]
MPILSLASPPHRKRAMLRSNDFTNHTWRLSALQDFKPGIGQGIGFLYKLWQRLAHFLSGQLQSRDRSNLPPNISTPTSNINMPPLSPEDLVLVTGANGHVAQHVVDQFLSLPTGPRVRATVRSASSAAGLESHFAASLASSRLEIVLIPDLLAPDAFSEALTDVTHIAHVASPLAINVTDVSRDLLAPAITGTTALLTAALTSPSLKSVVVTGSFAAVMDVAKHPRPGYVYTAADWNPITYAEAADPALDLSRWPAVYRPFVTYMASKTLAERAAWEVWERERPRWGLSVLLPSYIGGPYVLPLKGGAEGLSWSTGLVWGVAKGGKLPAVDYPDWTDVRDVAGAHVRALEGGGGGGGGGVFLGGGGITYSDIADIVRKNFTQLKPSDEKQVETYHDVDTSEAAEVLGITEWTSMEKMVVDSVSQVLEYEGK